MRLPQSEAVCKFPEVDVVNHTNISIIEVQVNDVYDVQTRSALSLQMA